MATKEDKNSGSCQCLLDFFLNGYELGRTDTGKDCWIIKSTVKGYIDIEIPAEALDDLRKNIVYNIKTKIEDVVKELKFVRDWVAPWAEPRVFPVSENAPATLPGPTYGHRVEGKTIAETWVKILQRIKTTGVIRPTGYDGQWQELIDLVAIVTNEPKDFYFPEPNYLPMDREFIKEYIPQVLDDAPQHEGAKYTYGQRLRSWFGKDQIEQVITKLVNEIDAASAVMSLWDVEDHEKGGSPCLNHIWLRVVNGKLSMTATFRSNDMFSAWPANAMGLRALQEHICDEVARHLSTNLTLGPLITISQSAHIYDDTWDNVNDLIKKQYTKIINKRDYYDPCGNFLIELENNEIVVRQTTPESGEVVNCFKGMDCLKIAREICAACPSIQPEHIAYIGIELEKAWHCSWNNYEYVQDKT
jgi:thymidylate synthase